MCLSHSQRPADHAAVNGNDWLLVLAAWLADEAD